MKRALPIAILALMLSPALASAKPKKAPPAAEPSIIEPIAPARAPDPPKPRPPSSHELAQASEAQVRARLGAPDVARAEGAGGLWTYRFRSCALLVFFKREEGQPLHVSGFSAGPRRRGQSSPSVDNCMVQALEAHDDPSQSDDPIQSILDAPSAAPPQN
jgi:hypothetical protein